MLDESYTSYRCVPCAEGYIQPSNNSWEKCYKAPDEPPTMITEETTSVKTHTERSISITGTFNIKYRENILMVMVYLHAHQLLTTKVYCILYVQHHKGLSQMIG